MRGIILAGGAGTRLFPSTLAVSKQLLTIYDKPMIYYPMSTLMLANIREVLIISTPRDTPLFKELFGNGIRLGMNIEYSVQEKPRGLADAFIVGEPFIGEDSVCLVLGDNIFYGQGLSDLLKTASSRKRGATVFGYHVSNPSEFGVVEFDSAGKVQSIQEKPAYPKSNYAVPGLYFYDNKVIDIAKGLAPSERGEIEITGVNNEYLRRGELNVQLFGRGMAWLDTGNHRNMLAAAQFVETIQTRQGLYVSCIEEIAYRQGFIEAGDLLKQAETMNATEYGQYLFDVARQEPQQLAQKTTLKAAQQKIPQAPH